MNAQIHHGFLISPFVQGEILGRNSAGLIMNEGNLIIQQVSKDSAGD